MSIMPKRTRAVNSIYFSPISKTAYGDPTSEAAAGSISGSPQAHASVCELPGYSSGRIAP